MSEEGVKQKSPSVLLPFFYVMIGGALTLLGSVITELYLIPSKEMKIQSNKQGEYRLTKLYSPLMIWTGYGKWSMTSPAVFYKIHEIIAEYGYLADQELIKKYNEFLELVDFTSYEELKRGNLFQKPLPENIILEIIKQGKAPLSWTADSLTKGSKIQKEFNELLIKCYKKAYHDFMHN